MYCLPVLRSTNLLSITRRLLFFNHFRHIDENYAYNRQAKLEKCYAIHINISRHAFNHVVDNL